MNAEFGVFFLILALLASSLQSLYLLPSVRMRAPIALCMLPASLLQALCIALAFATLVTLRLDSDFSVVNIVTYSNLSLPTLYKIAGTWGNHEGSMLLWVLVLAGFGVTLACSRVETILKQFAVAMQSAVCAGVLLFILCTSNPFGRQFPPAIEGEALNPLLQDIGLAMHPPLLYTGYVGFSIVFSLAVAAMLKGSMGREWANAAHPWILAAWSALTIGIGFGSWWSYRVLGWGGWWFWDPVENISLLPWLAGTALLHSNIVLKKRGLLGQWVLLLSIITFALSLLGTFLVRSGVLNSVHSFASDPARGLFIMIYIVGIIGFALLLYAWRGGALQSTDEMLPVSREGTIVLNNLFLLTACATVLLGTVYPMLAEMIEGSKFTVGPPYFNMTFIPLLVIPLLFTGLSPLMPWKSASFKASLAKARPAALAAAAAFLVVMAAAKTDAVLAACGFGVAAWLAASSIQWLLGSAHQAKAVFLAHLGVAVIVAGITGVSLWKHEEDKWLAAGDSFAMDGYQLTYEKESSVQGENYTAQRGEFTVKDAHGVQLATLAPEYRIYDIVHTATNEASIYSSFASDLYAVIGEASSDGSHRSARIYYVPMIHFIWAGFVLMAFAGIIAIIQQKAVNRA